MLLGLPVVYYLLTCAAYVRTPSFMDHLESSVAMQALVVTQGKPIYTALDSADRFTLCYGPAPSLVGAAFMCATADPILAAKVCGAVQGMLSLAVLFALCYAGSGGLRASMATAYCAFLYLLFDHISYWIRPDSLLLLATSLSCSAMLLRARWPSLLLSSLGFALAVNAKIHAGIVLLPILLLYCRQRGWRWALGLVGLSAFWAVLPFVLSQSFSIRAYLEWLRTITRHTLDPGLAATNAQYVIFFFSPLLLVAIARRRHASWREWCGEPRTQAVGCALACFALTAALASKSGAGPHHLLPFAPLTAALMVSFGATPGADTRQASPSYSTRVIVGAILGAWALTVIVAAVGSQKEIVRFIRNDRGAETRRELESILSRYPGKAIVMGYGAEEGYEHTHFRPLLFNRTGDNFLDAAALMDMEASGLRIPQATLQRVAAQYYDMFLTPIGGRPFSMGTWYAGDRPLFDRVLSAVFEASYTKTEEGRYFSVWEAKR